MRAHALCDLVAPATRDIVAAVEVATAPRRRATRSSKPGRPLVWEDWQRRGAAEMRTEFPLPTLEVDTTDGYRPDIEAVLTFATDERTTGA